MTAKLPRCPFKACPVRYRDGDDRPCTEHASEQGIWTGRLEEFAGLIMAAPGEPDGGGRPAEGR